MRTRYEVAQSAAYGADCVLAIVAGLDDAELTRDARRGRALRARRAGRGPRRGRTARARSRSARRCSGSTTAICARSTPNLAVTAELLPLVPPAIVVISESGVRSREDVQPLFAAGARGVSDRRIADARATTKARNDSRACAAEACPHSRTARASRSAVVRASATSKAAVEAGADAVGHDLRAESPRRVSSADARAIARSVPPYVAVVAVLVNPYAGVGRGRCSRSACVPQFSGDETPEFCAASRRPRTSKRCTSSAARRTRRPARRRWPTAIRDARLLFDSRDGAALRRHGHAVRMAAASQRSRAAGA